VEKLALLCNPASGRMSQALQLQLKKKLKKCSSESKGVPEFEFWVRIGLGILHAKDLVILSALSYSKE
jgi:hypothetical protein